MEKAKCELCGEPMPDNEQMFKFHGFSGPCPETPKSELHSKVVVEYELRKQRDGKWFVVITVDRNGNRSIGPFSSESSARAAYDDLLAMMKSTGATNALVQ